MSLSKNQIKCVFCNIKKERIIIENNFFIVVRDNYPISQGHTLIIPKRHIDSFFKLNTEEFKTLQQVLKKAKTDLDSQFQPDAYNIGVNDGELAGQTINHLHIHLIPRYKDDMKNPKGGVRWIFPTKADYWS